jgi:adenylosuccinate lyase
MAEALSTALIDRMGRPEAMAAVERAGRMARRDDRSLADAAADDPEIARHLTREAIVYALRPEHFLGSAPVFVERVLRRWNV